MSLARNTDIILQVKNLHVSFHTYAGVVKAVRGVNFDLRSGEILAIVGESGCGKTVTSKAVLDLLTPPLATIGDTSEVLYKGKNILKMNKREIRGYRGKEVSMIFQDPMTNLNPTMKVGDQIAESLLNHSDISKKEAWDEAVTALHRVGIPNAAERANSYPHQLSGGMRQRVIIAIALICNPNILVADEPTTALDVTIQAQILDLILDIREQTGTSVILVTHDLGVVANFAERIAVMYAGQIVETGQTRDIFYSPHHPYTRALLDSIPTSGKDKNEGTLFSLKGTPPDLILDFPHCAFSDRCKYRMPICLKQMPDVTVVTAADKTMDDADISGEHNVRCWLQHPMAPSVGALNENRGDVQ